MREQRTQTRQTNGRDANSDNDGDDDDEERYYTSMLNEHVFADAAAPGEEIDVDTILDDLV